MGNLVGVDERCIAETDRVMRPILKTRRWKVGDPVWCESRKGKLVAALTTVNEPACQAFVQGVQQRVEAYRCDAAPPSQSFFTDHAAVTIGDDACVDAPLARDVMQYLTDLIQLRQDAVDKQVLQCKNRSYTSFYKPEILLVANGVRVPQLVFMDTVSWTAARGRGLRDQVAQSRRGWCIVPVSLAPPSDAESGHAVLLLFDGKHQQYFDPSHASVYNANYKVFRDFFTSTHLYLQPQDQPKLQFVDAEVESSQTLQGLLEPNTSTATDPRNKELFAGRCVMVCLIMMCCCLRFDCRDMQRMARAVRCVLKALPEPDRRTVFMRGLCSWQNEFARLTDDRFHTTTGDVLRAMRFRNYGQPGVCGVFTADGRHRCPEARSPRYVFCPLHTETLLGLRDHTTTTAERVLPPKKAVVVVPPPKAVFEIAGLDQLTGASAFPLLHAWVVDFLDRDVARRRVHRFESRLLLDDDLWARVTVLKPLPDALLLTEDAVHVLDVVFQLGDRWDGAIVFSWDQGHLRVVPYLRRHADDAPPPAEHLADLVRGAVALALATMDDYRRDAATGRDMSKARSRVYDALRTLHLANQVPIGAAHARRLRFAPTPRGRRTCESRMLPGLTTYLLSRAGHMTAALTGNVLDHFATLCRCIGEEILDDHTPVMRNLAVTWHSGGNVVIRDPSLLRPLFSFGRDLEEVSLHAPLGIASLEWLCQQVPLVTRLSAAAVLEDAAAPTAPPPDLQVRDLTLRWTATQTTTTNAHSWTGMVAGWAKGTLESLTFEAPPQQASSPTDVVQALLMAGPFPQLQRLRIVTATASAPPADYAAAIRTALAGAPRLVSLRIEPAVNSDKLWHIRSLAGLPNDTSLRLLL